MSSSKKWVICFDSWEGICEISAKKIQLQKDLYEYAIYRSINKEGLINYNSYEDRGFGIFNDTLEHRDATPEEIAYYTTFLL